MAPKGLITFIILIALIFGGIYFWIPKYRQFNETRLLVKEWKNLLQEKEKYFSRLSKDLTRLKEEYGSEIKIIDLALPNDPSIFKTFILIKEESLKNDLVVSKFKIANLSSLGSLKKTVDSPTFSISDDKKMTIKETLMDVSLMGSYSSFKKFLSSLEENARLFSVESISFSSVSKKEKEEARETIFNLKIKTYSY